MANSIFSVIGSQTRLLVGEKLNLTGGTLTGSLILSGAPSQTNEAATKGYIDTVLANLTQYARLDGADFTGDVTGTNLNLSGNLTVSGTITAIETNNTTITDSIISLSKGTSGSANASSDSGILIERGSTENNAAFFWDEGDDAFKFATTSSDATATDLGGTSAVADVVVRGLNTNGNDLGTLEQFYAGLALASGTAVIPASEFDAVATAGIVSIVGVTSPFSTATLAMSYSTAEEIFYDIKEVSNSAPATSTFTVTVQSVSGSNKYFIDGVQQNTLDLYEGNTYIFNYPSGHPLKFSTTPNGTHGGGSEYTTGVTHNSSTQVTLVVASGAPTLYYYCEFHSDMGGTSNRNTIVSLELTAISEAGLSEFRGAGTITVNGEVISFS